MSDDIIPMIREAWDRLKPVIEQDPDELKRRLARRRSGVMSRPPRAWCAGIRAADTRITPGTAILTPEEAGYPRSAVSGEFEYRAHEVTIDARLVRRLCAPVGTDWPYSVAEDLQKKLGISKHNMRAAIRMGVFDTVRKIPGLGGKRGWPVTTVYSRRLLDPSARLRKYPDPLWGTEWAWAAERVPEDLCQTIRRVPERRGARGIGVDYTGWKWICPACGQPCRMIFYPVPPLWWVQLLKHEFHDTDPDHPDALKKGNNTFACMRCHKILYVTRVNYRSWNQLVTFLSAGLLYGREVAKPSGWAYKRERAYHPVFRREPSRRRVQVLEMLERGMSVEAMARELEIGLGVVYGHLRLVYRQRGMKSLEELRESVLGKADVRSIDSEAGTGFSGNLRNRAPEDAVCG